MSQFLTLLHTGLSRVAAPTAIVMGAPRLVVQMVNAIPFSQLTCWQMDLFQADRTRAELAASGLAADVQTTADLWDLPPEYQTVIIPSPPRGERDLKIDMVEQAFHVLREGGTLLVLSPIENDQFYPKLVKKIFGKTWVVQHDEGTIIWASRHGDHPRRRHEVPVQARVDAEGEPLRFLTRPGVFTYGRLDLGTRALLAAVEVNPGERVLDLGCGSGAGGIAAARRVQPAAHVTFVDSNLRAVGLAEINARANGLVDFEAHTASRLEGLTDRSFDVILTNPPYYALQSIARLFIERSRNLLKPGGRLYLVTRQFDQIDPIVRQYFGEADLFESRGYIILVATAP